MTHMSFDLGKFPVRKLKHAAESQSKVQSSFRGDVLTSCTIHECDYNILHLQELCSWPSSSTELLQLLLQLVASRFSHATSIDRKSVQLDSLSVVRCMTTCFMVHRQLKLHPKFIAKDMEYDAPFIKRLPITNHLRNLGVNKHTQPSQPSINPASHQEPNPPPSIILANPPPNND